MRSRAEQIVEELKTEHLDEEPVVRRIPERPVKAQREAPKTTFTLSH